MFSTTILCDLDMQSWLTVGAGVGFFWAVTLFLVVILLVAKRYLVQSGDVTIDINEIGRAHV